MANAPRRPSCVADLAFPSALPRAIHGNVKSRATLKSYSSWCPVGSDVDTSAGGQGTRTSEPGRQEAPP